MANGITSPYLLPYPLQTDPVNVSLDMQNLAEQVNTQLGLKSTIASPTFTGTPSAPTQATSDNSTKIATTEFVKNQSYLTTTLAASTYAPLASPAFTGNATATTQSLGNNSTRIATTAFVANALANFTTLPSQSGANGKFLSSDGTNASWNTITAADVSGLSTVINGLSSTYSPLNLSFSTQSATAYVLVAGDASKQVEMVSSSANTVAIPTDASVAFPIGTTILIASLGTGQTTIIASDPGTTTISATPGYKLRTRYSVATLVKRAANTWLLSGDLVA
jgi:hypothetical protein